MRIFLSYRREDTAAIAGRIYDRLRSHFGADCVFMDIDTIPFGMDFRKILTEAVSRCDVLLAVIGDKWMPSLKDGAHNTGGSTDFVRVEVEAALAREIPVIPLLIGGTAMPASNSLPAPLSEICYRQAVQVDIGRDFDSHVSRLIRGLEQLSASLLPEAATPTPKATKPAAARPLRIDKSTGIRLRGGQTSLRSKIALSLLATIVISSVFWLSSVKNKEQKQQGDVQTITAAQLSEPTAIDDEGSGTRPRLGNPNAKIYIDSVPSGATVVLLPKADNEDEPKQLGKTPLVLERSQCPSLRFWIFVEMDEYIKTVEGQAPKLREWAADFKSSQHFGGTGSLSPFEFHESESRQGFYPKDVLSLSGPVHELRFPFQSRICVPFVPRGEKLTSLYSLMPQAGTFKFNHDGLLSQFIQKYKFPEQEARDAIESLSRCGYAVVPIDDPFKKDTQQVFLITCNGPDNDNPIIIMQREEKR